MICLPSWARSDAGTSIKASLGGEDGGDVVSCGAGRGADFGCEVMERFSFNASGPEAGSVCCVSVTLLDARALDSARALMSSLSC